MKKSLSILFTASNPELFGQTLKRFSDEGSSIWCTSGSRDVLMNEFGIRRQVHAVSRLDGIPEHTDGVKVGAMRAHSFYGILTDESIFVGVDTPNVSHIPNFNVVIVEPYPLKQPKDGEKPKIDLSLALLKACYKLGNAIPVTCPKDLEMVQKAIQRRKKRRDTIPTRMRDMLELKAAKFVSRYEARVYRMLAARHRKKYPVRSGQGGVNDG